MQQTLSTAAWALHDLGVATSLGGSVYGRLALNPAAEKLPAQDRNRVIAASWSRFAPLNLISHVIFGITWLVGRFMFSGREVDRSAGGLVLAKDVLVGAAIASGVASTLAGAAQAQAIRREANDVQASMNYEGTKAASVARTAGIINIAALAGIVCITAVLAMKSGRSTRWSFSSRRAP